MKAGEWLGPWVLCHTLEAVMKKMEPASLNVHVHVVSQPGGAVPVLYTARHASPCPPHLHCTSHFASHHCLRCPYNMPAECVHKSTYVHVSSASSLSTCACVESGQLELLAKCYMSCGPSQCFRACLLSFAHSSNSKCVQLGYGPS